MKQLELFGKREDREYALSLTMDEYRAIYRKRPEVCKYFYRLRSDYHKSIQYQVARATFIAKFEDVPFSRLPPY